MTDHPNRSAGSEAEIARVHDIIARAISSDGLTHSGLRRAARDVYEHMNDDAQGAALRAAAERVCWFDWSDNDMDAVAAIDALRKVITSQPSPAATVETRDLKVSGEVIAELMDECEALRAQLRLSADTAEVVSRLRRIVGPISGETQPLMKEAADLIERLSAVPQEVPDRQATAALIREYLQKRYGTAAVQMSSDGMERIYYNGVSLLDLADALSLSRPELGSGK